MGIHARQSRFEGNQCPQLFNIQTPTGAIQALPPERGCVEDQPQQLYNTNTLEYA